MPTFSFMRHWICFAFILVAAAGTQAAVSKKAPAGKKAAVSRYGPKRKTPVPAKKATPAAKTSARRKSSTGRQAPSVARVSQPPRQMAPSNERYREIQEALATKGYLASQPNGTWDQNSQDAMRRFQADQKIDPNGKLTSRSIIALGLGSSSAAPAPKQ